MLGHFFKFKLMRLYADLISLSARYDFYASESCIRSQLAIPSFQCNEWVSNWQSCIVFVCGLCFIVLCVCVRPQGAWNEYRQQSAGASKMAKLFRNLLAHGWELNKLFSCFFFFWLGFDRARLPQFTVFMCDSVGTSDERWNGSNDSLAHQQRVYCHTIYIHFHCLQFSFSLFRFSARHW